MLDQWSKAATIVAAIVLIVSAIIAPSVGGVIWLARMNYEVEGLQTNVSQLQTDVSQLQTDVSQLQTDVSQLKSDVGQIQETQQIMLEILRGLADDLLETRADLTSHTHDTEGRAQFTTQ